MFRGVVPYKSVLQLSSSWSPFNIRSVGLVKTKRSSLARGKLSLAHIKLAKPREHRNPVRHGLTVVGEEGFEGESP